MRKLWWTVPVVALVLLAGNFHIFTGSAGIRLVPRVTFAFAEFIVNEDSLRSMPSVVLASQFPLSSMALRAEDAREIDQARRIANP